MAADKRTGASGLMPGVHPSMADKTGFRVLTNMVCDVPGFAIKRRGIEALAVNKYSELDDWDSGQLLPVQAWSFDNSIWVYFENIDPMGAVQSGIAVYEMTSLNEWGMVAQSTSGSMMLDKDKFKMRAKTFDRTLLVNTADGMKRCSSLGATEVVDVTAADTYQAAFRDAGVTQALDCRIPNVVTADNTTPGMHPASGFEWLPPESSVSFKICWIYRDENGRLLYGRPSGRTIVRNTSTTDSYAVSMLVPIPYGITDRFVMQEYRTRVIEKDGEGAIPDPGDDHFLSSEYRLTAADITAGYVLFEDISFDPLLGDPLYVNPGQEGPLQGRDTPPLARDIESFGNCAWYVNTTEKQGLTLKILAVDPGGANGAGIKEDDVIVVGDLCMVGSTVANEYVLDENFAIDDTSGPGSEVIRAIKTAESLAYKYNLYSNKFNARYYAYCQTTNNDIYGVVNFVEKKFHRPENLVADGPSPVYIGVDRIDAPTQILPAPVFTPDPSSALALIATVDVTTGDDTFVLSPTSALPNAVIEGDRIFVAPYGTSVDGGMSAIDGLDGQPFCVNTGVRAGVYTVLAATAGVGGRVECALAYGESLATASDVEGCYFHKIYDVTTGITTEARSQEARSPNAMYYSAPFEPEGVPHFNKLLVGATDQAVLRVCAITTSMFVFKEDGLWRIQGTDGQWIVNAVDPTCRLIAPESVQTVAGKVFAYTATGLVQITESGVTKISTNVGGYVDSYYRSLTADVRTARDIVSGAHSEDQAYLIGFPLSPFDPNNDLRARVVYRYHIPSKTWSEHTYQSNRSVDAKSQNIGALTTFRQTRYEAASPSKNYIERLVVALTGDADSIGIERRDGTAYDYCDIDVPITPAIISWESSEATIVFDAGLPDSVVDGCVLWLIVGGSYTNRTYRATVYSVGETNLPRDTITLYPIGVRQFAINGLNGSDVQLLPNGDYYFETSTATQYSLWPDLVSATVKIFKPIPSVLQYVPQTVGEGFEAAQASEVHIEFGSRARFSFANVYFGTDKNDTTGNAIINGLAYKEWSDWIVRSESTQTELRTTRTYFPKEDARGTQFFVTIAHNKAWEVFDVSGTSISIGDNSPKVRRLL